MFGDVVDRGVPLCDSVLPCVWCCGARVVRAVQFWSDLGRWCSVRLSGWPVDLARCLAAECRERPIGSDVAVCWFVWRRAFGSLFLGCVVCRVCWVVRWLVLSLWWAHLASGAVLDGAMARGSHFDVLCVGECLVVAGWRALLCFLWVGGRGGSVAPWWLVYPLLRLVWWG